MRAFVAGLIVLTVAESALAQQSYRARGFMRSGYSEKAGHAGEWTVRGSAHARQASVGVALYRAAELAIREGASEIRVTKQGVRSTTVSRKDYSEVSYNEVTTLTFRAVRGAADRSACDMAERERCMTLPVAGLLATYGPALAMPAALPGAVPAAQLTIVSRSPYQSAVADLLVRHPELRATPQVVAAPSAPPVARAAPNRQPVPSAATAPSAAELYAARLQAVQPVRGGDRRQGWTISD